MCPVQDETGKSLIMVMRGEKRARLALQRRMPWLAIGNWILVVVFPVLWLQNDFFMDNIPFWQLMLWLWNRQCDVIQGSNLLRI